jgi:hypothetical protein
MCWHALCTKPITAPAACAQDDETNDLDHVGDLVAFVVLVVFCMGAMYGGCAQILSVTYEVHGCSLCIFAVAWRVE